VVLDHALQYRAARVTRVGSIRISQSQKRGARGGVYEKAQQGVMKDVEEVVPSTADESLSSEPTHVQPSSLLHANEAWLRQLETPTTPRATLSEMVPEQQLRGDTTVTSMLLEPSSSSTTVRGIAETRPSLDLLWQSPSCMLPTSTSLDQMRHCSNTCNTRVRYAGRRHTAHQPSQFSLYSETRSTQAVVGAYD
jgi:hypothetical protein